jgi:hypothetical protein
VAKRWDGRYFPVSVTGSKSNAAAQSIASSSALRVITHVHGWCSDCGMPTDSYTISGWRALRRACSARSLRRFSPRLDLRRALSDLDGSTPPCRAGAASRRPWFVRWNTPFLTPTTGSGMRRGSFAGDRIGLRTTAGSSNSPVIEGARPARRQLKSRELRGRAAKFSAARLRGQRRVVAACSAGRTSRGTR